MTAWNTLIGNSTVLSSSTAWQHLNNQNPPGPVTIGLTKSVSIVHNVTADIGTALSSSTSIPIMEANTGAVISANIVQQTLEASICQL